MSSQIIFLLHILGILEHKAIPNQTFIKTFVFAEN